MSVIEPKVGSMITYTGEAIDPFDPDLSTIHIEDIAHALGNICRFTGHVRHFYSVAQHSVIVSRYAEKHPMWGLLHDASEAYLSDIARPVKHHLGFGEAYRATEKILMKAICEKFGLPEEMPAEVAELDEVILANEIRHLMPAHETYALWDEYPEIDKADLAYWPPHKSKLMFLERYAELGGE